MSASGGDLEVGVMDNESGVGVSGVTAARGLEDRLCTSISMGGTPFNSLVRSLFCILLAAGEPDSS